MSDAVETTPAAETAAPAVASPKKSAAKKAVGAKKPATKPNHPPVAEMVNAAIAALKEKKGSSLQAIKKYIAAQYKVDVEKQSTFIKKYLKSAVEKKILVQTKGSGAAGSFKLAEKVPKKAAVKKPVAKKPVAAKKPAAKKPVAAKKPAAKKPVAAKKPAAKKAPAKPKATKLKSPAKATKTGKVPAAAKPKAPKPKKAAAPKPKKAAPKAKAAAKN